MAEEEEEVLGAAEAVAVEAVLGGAGAAEAVARRWRWRWRREDARRTLAQEARRTDQREIVTWLIADDYSRSRRGRDTGHGCVLRLYS